MTGLPPGVHVLDPTAAGGAHTAVVGTDGRAYTCGLNDHAQLGHSPPLPSSPSLTPVDGLPDHDPIVSVSAGHHHTLCVTAGGELWAFGERRASAASAPTPRASSPPPRGSPRALPGRPRKRRRRCDRLRRRGSAPFHRRHVRGRGVRVGRRRGRRPRPRRRRRRSMAILVETVPRTRPATRSRARGRGGVGSRGARRDDALGVRGRCRSRVDVGPSAIPRSRASARTRVPANVAFLATPRRVPGVGRVTSLAAEGTSPSPSPRRVWCRGARTGTASWGGGARADGKSDRPRTAIQTPEGRARDERRRGVETRGVRRGGWARVRVGMGWLRGTTRRRRVERGGSSGSGRTGGSLGTSRRWSDWGTRREPCARRAGSITPSSSSKWERRGARDASAAGLPRRGSNGRAYLVD